MSKSEDNSRVIVIFCFFVLLTTFLIPVLLIKPKSYAKNLTKNENNTSQKAKLVTDVGSNDVSDKDYYDEDDDEFHLDDYPMTNSSKRAEDIDMSAIYTTNKVYQPVEKIYLKSCETNIDCENELTQTLECRAGKCRCVRNATGSVLSWSSEFFNCVQPPSGYQVMKYYFYKFVEKARTQSEAYYDCVRDNAHVATARNHKIYKRIVSTKNISMWLGTFRSLDNQYRRHDGMTRIINERNTSEWCKNEPSGNVTSKCCVITDSRNCSMSVDCTKTYPYVCVKTFDLCDDSTFFWSHKKTNGNKQYMCKQRDKVPYMSDCNKDKDCNPQFRCRDYKCVCSHESAFINGTCFNLKPFRLMNNYYYLNKTRMTWNEANKFCASIGLTLMTVNSINEPSDVWKLFKTELLQSSEFWTGGHRDTATKNFTFLHTSNMLRSERVNRVPIEIGEDNQLLRTSIKGKTGCLAVFRDELYHYKEMRKLKVNNCNLKMISVCENDPY